MNTSSLMAACLIGVAAFASLGQASVVSIIDPAGGLTVDHQVGSVDMATMQALITARNDTTTAGVLNAEGFTVANTLSGDFTKDPDYSKLKITITGASRYGRSDGSHATSGTQFGFVSGSDTWTLGGNAVTYFGFTQDNTGGSGVNNATVTATFSDGSTQTYTSTTQGVYFFGFHQDNLSITKILFSEPPGGAFTAYDDVSFVAVPEPASLSTLAAAGVLMLRRRHRRP